MENTIVKSAKLTSTDKNELNVGIKETINNIKKLVEKWNYKVSGNLDSLSTTDFSELIRIGSNNHSISKSQLKKLRDLINRVNHKPTLRNSNIFLNYLSKLFDVEKVKIELSDEEKSIQNARKEWKDIKLKYEYALTMYKTLKGDFYKSRM